MGPAGRHQHREGRCSRVSAGHDRRLQVDKLDHVLAQFLKLGFFALGVILVVITLIIDSTIDVVVVAAADGGPKKARAVVSAVDGSPPAAFNTGVDLGQVSLVDGAPGLVAVELLFRAQERVQVKFQSAWTRRLLEQQWVNFLILNS